MSARPTLMWLIASQLAMARTVLLLTDGRLTPVQTDLNVPRHDKAEIKKWKIFNNKSKKTENVIIHELMVTFCVSLRRP